MSYDEEYFENGISVGRSLYQHYRWIPELTIPMAHHLSKYCEFKEDDEILDFGCAKGYLVKALRLLGYQAFGRDISTYAISVAPRDVEQYLQLVGPGARIQTRYEWIIAKDVLEHISYAEIGNQMQVIADGAKNIFVMVPLAEDGKYVVPLYEIDETHRIRENLDWWMDLLESKGFNVEATHHMGPFKKNWERYPRGNGLLIGRCDE